MESGVIGVIQRVGLHVEKDFKKELEHALILLLNLVVDVNGKME
jgi:hypothetical protein